MSRASLYLFLFLTLFLAFPSGFADEVLPQTAQKIADLEREIIDFKMSRTDSWMFWMAVFMTFVAVLTATFGIAIPVLTSQSLTETVKKIEADQDKIRTESQQIREIREYAEREQAEIRQIRHRASSLGNFFTETPPAPSTFESADSSYGLSAADDINKLNQRIQKAQNLQEEGNSREAEALWMELAVEKNLPTQIRSFAWTNAADIKVLGDDADNDKKLYGLGMYDNALDLDSENSAALNNRGLLQKSLDRLDLALDDFNKIIELGLDDFSTYANRAHIYFLLERLADSIHDLKKAYELLPEDSKEVPGILFQLGSAYFLNGDLAEAFASFEKAKELASEDARDEISERISNFLASVQIDENR